MSGRPWLIAVTVEGVNLPRFLRRAGEMGLLLTGVRIRGKHLSAFAREDDVMTLRMMAENGGWRFSVGNRQGTGRLMTWIRHRLALLSALMLGIGALIGASQVSGAWRLKTPGFTPRICPNTCGRWASPRRCEKATFIRVSCATCWNGATRKRRGWSAAGGG